MSFTWRASRRDPPEAGFLLRAPAGARLRPIPTGSASLDALLRGGFPRGQISELIGARSSGRTRVLLGCLAAVTAAGGLASLVDATDGFDPASAHAAGVRLDHLLWVRCGGRLVTAFQAADLVVRGGGFELVVLDLVDLPLTVLARASPTALVRLQRAAEATPAALLMVSPVRLAGSLAGIVVALERSRRQWRAGGPGLLGDLTVEARLVRARGRAPGAGVHLAWSLPG